MELKLVRNAIRDTLKARTISEASATKAFAGVQVYARMVPQQSLPSIWVMGPEEIEYHVTSVEGSKWTLRLQGFAAGEPSSESAQEQVDEWLSDSGQRSLKEALEAEATLGGVVEDTIVTASEGYALYVVEGVIVLGCDWLVDVWA